MNFEIIDIAVPAFFIILFFWLLFIEKTFPGKGWFAFSIKDVDIKVRILSFFLFIGGMFCVFIDKRLFAGILAGTALCLLILCQ